MPRVNQLSVWLHEEHVATLRRTGPGRVNCEYTAAALSHHPLGIPLLSCSLPLRRTRQPAWAFVTGLLPEGQHRTSMSKKAGVDTLDALGLLDRYGRDVAGALTIAADDPLLPDRTPSLVDLSDEDLVEEVATLPAQSLALHDDSELSLAGLEDKLLLVHTPAGWARPVHGYPSTHILKVDNRVHRGTVLLEHDSLQLARAAGLPAADSRLVTVGDADCIIVERFDRTIAGDGSVQRIHQEDACQALGIDPADQRGRAKYEAHGGPSLSAIADLLSAYSLEPDHEMTTLLQRVAFTVVIGDADAHGKNVSLLHLDPAHITLAPLYDTVPTALWPRLRPTAAMRVGGRDQLPAITSADLLTEARRWGLTHRRAHQALSDVLERLTVAAADLPTRPGPGLRDLVHTNLTRLQRTF